LTAGSILLDELGSKDRAKTAYSAKNPNNLKWLSYSFIYHASARQILPAAGPHGQILPGKNASGPDDLDEPRL
jgi:hypothetical protein